MNIMDAYLQYVSNRLHELPHEQHQLQTMIHPDANPKLLKHHLKYRYG